MFYVNKKHIKQICTTSLNFAPSAWSSGIVSACHLPQEIESLQGLCRVVVILKKE
jgi:hypothetical protein